MGTALSLDENIRDMDRGQSGKGLTARFGRKVMVSGGVNQGGWQAPKSKEITPDVRVIEAEDPSFRRRSLHAPRLGYGADLLVTLRISVRDDELADIVQQSRRGGVLD